MINKTSFDETKYIRAFRFWHVTAKHVHFMSFMTNSKVQTTFPMKISLNITLKE